jgi:NAD(P)-dependent dehydrogenase (short-subunit alcohol dehydrogenase family)
MAQDFTGKTVVVTGGNSGIGEGIALAFAERGAQVLITGRRAEALAGVVKKHDNIQSIVADVSKEADAEAVIEKVKQHTGRLDVLVNNAGIGAFATLEQASAAAIREMFDINVLGLSFVTKAALPLLKEARGAVINISSTVGTRPVANMSHYAATKAAVDSLTKSWALELAPDGVRVNAVSPGPVDTPIFGKAGLPADQIEGMKQGMAAGLPVGRIGVPDDISYWVLALADPAASWMTGQIITPDGGMNLG